MTIYFYVLKSGKLRLNNTARTWYQSYGYSATITWSTIGAHMLAYFVPSDYARHARNALANCRMGKRNITNYIDDFRHLLVCCTDVEESEAKFLFENNIADWLASYVLP